MHLSRPLFCFQHCQSGSPQFFSPPTYPTTCSSCRESIGKEEIADFVLPPFQIPSPFYGGGESERLGKGTILLTGHRLLAAYGKKYMKTSSSGEHIPPYHPVQASHLHIGIVGEDETIHHYSSEGTRSDSASDTNGCGELWVGAITAGTATGNITAAAHKVVCSGQWERHCYNFTSHNCLDFITAILSECDQSLPAERCLLSRESVVRGHIQPALIRARKYIHLLKEHSHGDAPSNDGVQYYSAVRRQTST